jgi:hypothetical protein
MTGKIKIERGWIIETKGRRGTIMKKGRNRNVARECKMERERIEDREKRAG